MTRHLFLGATLGLMVLSSCGNPPTPETPSRHRALEGDLVTNVKKLRTGPYHGACDIQNEAIQQEIAIALDTRQGEIQNFIRALPPSAHWNRVALGPTFVREPRNTLPPPQEGWSDYTSD